MADFETTTKLDDCRVWAWGLCGIGEDWQALTLDNVELGTDLDSFLETIQQSNTTTYFHNLRFDGRFLLDWLLKRGYDHVATSGNISAGCFKTLISDTGQFYSITIRWDNGFSTEFRDSLKKLPMSVAEVAKAFDMAVGKGDLDYELERPVGWRITDDEAEYIKRDVLIIARAVGQQLHNGLTKLTVGSDALFEYKKLLGKENYRRLFPVLSTAMDLEIRRAYRGGFTYADPRHTGRVTRGGHVLDVNSLYPSVMYYNAIPYGEPEWVDGYVEPTKARPCTIFSITFTARLKPGHIPCIQIKGTSRFHPTDYLSTIDEPISLMVTNVDYALMCDHYDMHVLEWNGGWRFEAANGLFDSYIDKWMRIKSHSTGGMRALSKLQLNSLYGKFASNPDVTGKEPYLDEHGAVQLRMGPHEERNAVYTAAGVFITSYARDVTIRAAQANYESFAYADTDSLHLLRDTIPDNIRVHPSDLGAWKHEYSFDSAYYIRAKAYFEHKLDGQFENHIAGIPTFMSSVLTFDDLKPGRVIRVEKRNTEAAHVTRMDVGSGDGIDGVLMHGKLQPRSVPGGVVLMDVPFELDLR